MGFIEKIGLGIVLDISNKMSGKAKKAGDSLDKLAKKSTKTSEKVVVNTDRMTAALSRYARGFTVGFKLTTIGAALQTPLVGLSMHAAKTQHVFSELRSLMIGTGISANEVEKQLDILANKVSNLAENTISSYDDILQSLYPISSKFITRLGADITGELISPVNALAVAGKGTMLDAVRLVNQTFDTFGATMVGTNEEKAKKIVNTLLGAIKNYDTDLTRLTESMKYATPQAVQLGLSLSETVSIVGALTGIMITGSKAGTAYDSFLRGIIQFTRRLREQTVSATTSISDFIKVSEGGSLGGRGANKLASNPLSTINYRDAKGRMKPVLDIVDSIAKLFHITKKTDIATLLQNQYLMQAFGSEGIRAIAILIKMNDEVRNITKGIETQNVTQSMLNAITDDTYSRFAELKNSAIVLVDTLGKLLLPDVDKLIIELKKLKVKITDFANTHKNLIIWGARATSVVGILFIMAGSITVLTFSLKSMKEALYITSRQFAWLLSKLFILDNTIPVIALRLKLLALQEHLVTAATWLWNAALAANPIVWIVVAIIALGAAIYLVIKNWDWLTDKISKFWTWFKAKLDDIPDWMLLAFPIFLIIKHWDYLREKITAFFNWLVETSLKVWNWLRKVAGDMPDWFIIAIGLLGGPLGWLLSTILLVAKHWETVKVVVMSVWGTISNFIDSMSEKIGIVIDAIKIGWKGLAIDLKDIWTDLKLVFSIVWDAITGTFNKFVDLVANNPIWVGYIKMIKWMINNGRSFLKWLGFGETFTGIPNELPSPRKPVDNLALSSAYGGGYSLAGIPNSSTDYSTHRTQINVYETKGPKETANAIDKALNPEGVF